MSKETTIQIGPGFSGLLTIAFIVLKLTHVINWSWVWVLSPLWIGLAITLLFLVGFLITVAIIAVLGNIFK